MGQQAEPEQGRGEERRLPVVGIGASAGGLTALQNFLNALPAVRGLAFVVVTHMDPQRESLLPELLQRHTEMTVIQVRKRTPIEANHVYVIPPGQQIVVTDTHLDVREFDEPRGQRMPVDRFFRSLASVHKEAVAIILSGGGADGAVGVKAIKAEGGLLMVQHPDEAEHDSMPRAAIATGVVDVVLPVVQLAEKLAEYHASGNRLRSETKKLTDETLEVIFRILTQVQAQTGHDFSQYKRSTILRRIQRRMQLHGLATLEAYLEYLRHSTDEAQALFADLLIGVTNFFRDRDAWEALAEEVIPRLFEGKEQGDTIRVWSIGCATGEEAYSLAILLMEHAARLEQTPSGIPGLQVFASDLDDGALTRAREGLYPQAIEADVGPERLERWFLKEGHYYRIRREVRDIVLFSNHSILRDPPFSRLDLITCRNLLIYLQRELQQNVFQIFHYSLNPEGYLFLGNSETAGAMQHLFRTVDKEHRLYQARPWRGEQPNVPSLPLAMRRHGIDEGRRSLEAEEHPTWGRTGKGFAAALHQVRLEEAAPPSVLVNDEYQIVHMSERAGRYLHHRGGVISTNLLEVVREELQFELRTALFQAFAQKRTVLSRSVAVDFNGAPHRVVVAVRPHPHTRSGETEESGEQSGLRPEATERMALVFFLENEAGEQQLVLPEGAEETAEPTATQGRSRRPEAIISKLEAEVQYLRERLQATTEEYESSTEELKAANEELQSINEEFRSATEELETSKEELQSVNEELQTVNAELKNKLEEISRAHGDLENLMTATEIATLFLNRELHIERYTPGTVELFNIMPTDRGRPITHLTNKLNYDTLVEDAQSVLDNLVPIEREVQDAEGRWLLAQLRPYSTPDHRIAGVVLTLVDISELKQAEEALRAEKEYSEKIVHTVREGMLVLKPDLTVEFANDSFFQMFEVSAAETIGSQIYDLGNGQWDIPDLRILLEEILPQEKIFNDYRVEHRFETVGRRIMLLNARRLDHVERILLAIEDITDREQYEQELRESEKRLRKVLSIGTVGVLFFDENGTIVDANNTFLEQVGYSRAELEAGELSWRRLTPPEWIEDSEEQLEILAATGLIGPYEKQYYRKDGSRWWFLFAGAKLDDGTVVEYCIDISKQKEIEARLRERERELAALNETLEERIQTRTGELRTARDLFQALFHANPLPVSLTRLSDGRFLDVNEAYLDYFGYEREQLLGQSSLELNIGLSGQARDQLLDRLRVTGSVRNEEIGVAHPDGTPHTVLVFMELLDLDGTDAAISSFVDISERKQMEEQMRRLSAQLTMAEHEERGRVAQILHDDLQQQLYGMQIELTFLRDKTSDEALLREIDEMDEALAAATVTVRQLSVDLSPPILEGEGLAEAIRWLSRQMQQQYRLEVELDAQSSFPVANHDRRVLLFQMVRELLFNVVKHARVPQVRVSLQALGGDDKGSDIYRIDVVDEGVGFDVEQFLKPGSGAYGRGLWNMRERLRLIGGQFEVQSAPDAGTQVTIIAPVEIGEQPKEP
jgi:two-component system CheB/CheR fusion protein